MTLNIKSSTIFDLNFNNTTLKLNIGSDLIYSKIKTYTLPEIKPILLNNLVQNPEIVYYEIRDCYSQNTPSTIKDETIRHNLIVLPSSMIGVEYVKTHSYTSPLVMEGKENILYNCVVEVLAGSVNIIMQDRLEDPKSLVVESVGIVKLKQGDKFWIPTGVDFEFVNVKATPAILSKIYRQDYKMNYNIFEEAKGLSHYIIRKNGRTEVVPNCCYTNPPKIKLIKHKEYLKKNKLEITEKIYNISQRHSAKIA